MRQIGKLELAQGGTFFFDEIGDFPLHLQGKILRVHRRQIHHPPGQRQGRSRWTSASSSPPTRTWKKPRREKRFRQDLYFRITSFPIVLPPLRDRPDDILLLADYFCKKLSLEIKKSEFTLRAPAREKLLAYTWPGNVRELQNTIERAVIISRGPRVHPAGDHPAGAGVPGR